MGALWLRSMPDVLRAAGLAVATYSGWETRARSTGGYDDVRAVQVHHTASSASPASDMSYMWNGSPDRPVGAIYLARDGLLTVGAAGATNTSGKGGPLSTSKGSIPLDSANKYVISIEAANNGVGEPWPLAQVDAYIRAVAALNKAYGLLVGDTHGHMEWTSRKIDPAGNSPYAVGGNSWDMNQFRSDVFLVGEPPPEPEPEPEPPPQEEDDPMLFCAKDSSGRIWIGDRVTRVIPTERAIDAHLWMASMGGPALHQIPGTPDWAVAPLRITWRGEIVSPGDNMIEWLGNPGPDADG